MIETASERSDCHELRSSKLWSRERRFPVYCICGILNGNKEGAASSRLDSRSIVTKLLEGLLLAAKTIFKWTKHRDTEG